MNRKGFALAELPIAVFAFVFLIGWFVVACHIAFSHLPFYFAVPAVLLSPFALLLGLFAAGFVLAVPVWIVDAFLSRFVRPQRFRKYLRQIQELDEREGEDSEYGRVFQQLEFLAAGMNARDYHMPVRNALLNGDGKSRSWFLRFAGNRSEEPLMRGVVAELAGKWADPLGPEAREITQKWEAEAGSGQESRTPPPPQERPTGR